MDLNLMKLKKKDNRVTMSAACKKAAIDGEAWVTWHGERLLLRRFESTDEIWGLDVVYVVSGHFRTGILTDKDGFRPTDDHYKYRLQIKQIRAVIKERHKRVKI